MGQESIDWSFEEFSLLLAVLERRLRDFPCWRIAESIAGFFFKRALSMAGVHHTSCDSIVFKYAGLYHEEKEAQLH